MPKAGARFRGDRGALDEVEALMLALRTRSSAAKTAAVDGGQDMQRDGAPRSTSSNGVIVEKGKEIGRAAPTHEKLIACGQAGRAGQAPASPTTFTQSPEFSPGTPRSTEGVSQWANSLGRIAWEETYRGRENNITGIGCRSRVCCVAGCAPVAVAPPPGALQNARVACNAQYPARVGNYLAHTMCVNAAIDRYALPTAPHPDLVRLQENIRSRFRPRSTVAPSPPRSGKKDEGSGCA